MASIQLAEKQWNCRNYVAKVTADSGHRAQTAITLRTGPAEVMTINLRLREVKRFFACSAAEKINEELNEFNGPSDFLKCSLYSCHALVKAHQKL